MSAHTWRCAVEGCREAKVSQSKSVQPTPEWGWGKDGGERCPDHHRAERLALYEAVRNKVYVPAQGPLPRVREGRRAARAG